MKNKAVSYVFLAVDQVAALGLAQVKHFQRKSSTFVAGHRSLAGLAVLAPHH